MLIDHDVYNKDKESNYWLGHVGDPIHTWHGMYNESAYGRGVVCIQLSNEPEISATVAIADLNCALKNEFESQYPSYI